MQVLDYGRSFVTFVTEGRANNARLQIESQCTICHTASGERRDYFFYAACKSEDTFAKRDLFYADNYDFCGLFSAEEYAIFRTHATHVDSYREEGLWRERFEDVQWRLAHVEARALVTNRDIVGASLAGEPLVGLVEWMHGPYEIRLEFPIKTMNANDIDWVWQVDTGPVPFPDFSLDVPLHVQRLAPAYIAYNAPHFADFVVQAPMEIGGIEVTHYIQRTHIEALTQVLAVT
jgi:hypothetical protein